MAVPEDQPGLLFDAQSWGNMKLGPSNIDRARPDPVFHSDSRFLLSKKPEFDWTYEAPTYPADFTPDSSPPRLTAPPVTRARAGKGKVAAPGGASADDTIEIEATPEPRPQQSSRKAKKAARGRSLGDGSTRPIKLLRAAAEAGCIDSALKLGWAVERLTKMYNKKKVANGVAVTSELQPIDNPDLLARIEERKQNARVATQRRTDRLRAQAATGDREAARKLGLGKKSMEEFEQKFGYRARRKVKQESLSSVESRDLDAEWQQDLDERRTRFYSMGPSMSSAEGPTYVKSEAGASSFFAAPYPDPRATLRDSFGKTQNLPGFNPLPAFTPNMHAAMPAAYPGFLPSNATPQPAIPQLAHPPNNLHPPFHMPATNKAMELEIKLAERTKFLEYAQFMVAEVQREISEYQAPQARLPPSYYDGYPQDIQPHVTENIGRVPNAGSGKEFQFVQQTGQEDADAEEEMQMIDGVA
ncbi:hypothetical protein Slin15195_G112760 [Septoria linicola]|uniref:Uncharacterized protein n=1 Tax=Septoria linicola TaxID=215465 RepID=A0A9Q9B5X5_9PEZI|nr:hypothetical protein Slin15195_G112760 [Septoria linicola]